MVKILGFTDAYQISQHVSIGNSDDICVMCRHKMDDKPIHTVNKELRGKLLGKKVFKVGKFTICDDCLKEAYEEMFAEDEAIDSITDEELEAAKL